MIQMLIVLVLISLASWFMFRPSSDSNNSSSSGIRQNIEETGKLMKESADMIRQANRSVAAANENILKSAIQMFMAQNSSYPQNLDELVSAGLIRNIPRLEGFTLDYDPSTGIVKYIEQ